MTKNVTVADLQEHLAERLDDVKNGATLRVVVGETAIAQITAAQELSDDLILRPALRPMPSVDLPPLITKLDILEYLDEERGDR
jgi:antitoxin (DNA-binding transcriptional repressor) of toxin-antitoxin stability system